MKLLSVVALSVVIVSCRAGSGGNVSVECKTLTGKYEVAGGGQQEVIQDSCGPTVNIENKTIGINGQSFSQNFVLDGVRKLEQGGDVLNYRYYTRSWENDTWVDKWERYENAQFHSSVTTLFSLDNQGNLVVKDDQGAQKVYRRIR